MHIGFCTEAIKAYLFDSPFEGGGMREAFQWLGSLEGLRILDAGCGHGAFSVYAAGEGALPAALDVQMERLAFARDQSAGMGLPLQCVRGMSESLPFPGGIFDLVLSRSTLQYTRIPEALAEFHRVLKPGGALILVENLAHNPFLMLFRAFRGLTGNRLRLGPYAGNKAGVIRGYASASLMRRVQSGLHGSGCRFQHLFRPLSLGLRFAARRSSPAEKLDRAVERLDAFLMERIPVLRRLAWAGTVWGRKPGI
jgi:SAM-dependent methyltransferase